MLVFLSPKLKKEQYYRTTEKIEANETIMIESGFLAPRSTEKLATFNHRFGQMPEVVESAGYDVPNNKDILRTPTDYANCSGIWIRFIFEYFSIPFLFINTSKPIVKGEYLIFTVKSPMVNIKYDVLQLAYRFIISQRIAYTPYVVATEKKYTVLIGHHFTSPSEIEVCYNLLTSYSYLNPRPNIYFSFSSEGSISFLVKRIKEMNIQVFQTKEKKSEFEHYQNILTTVNAKYLLFARITDIFYPGYLCRETKGQFDAYCFDKNFVFDQISKSDKGGALDQIGRFDDLTSYIVKEECLKSFFDQNTLLSYPCCDFLFIKYLSENYNVKRNEPVLFSFISCPGRRDVDDVWVKYEKSIILREEKFTPEEKITVEKLRKLPYFQTLLLASQKPIIEPAFRILNRSNRKAPLVITGPNVENIIRSISPSNVNLGSK